MALTDLWEIKEELLTRIRSADVITVAARNVTTLLEEFNGDGLNQDFDVTHKDIKNVRTVTVNAVAQAFGTQYTVDYNDANPGRVHFAVAPPVGVNNVDITYDYGTDHIFPDYPKRTLKIVSYPRIAVEIMSASSRAGAIGGGVNIRGLQAEIVVYSKSLKEVDRVTRDIRNALIAAQKTFFYFDNIRPDTTGPLIPTIELSGGKTIYQRNATYIIPNQVEI